jgi:hypothetical protein
MSEKKELREIPKVLLELIEAFSQFDDMTGKQKKQMVIDKMGQLFNLDLDLIIIINEMVDVILEVHKHRTKIKKKAKKCISLCF